MLSFKDPKGAHFQWGKFGSRQPAGKGVFLIHETYQLQAMVGPFSEVALDLVEFSPDTVIFHSPPKGFLGSEMISEGLITFALIKSPYWHRLLFELREVVYMEWIPEIETADRICSEQVFPLSENGAKSIELHADGKVKIRNA
ncbi:hypothetical protein [Cyclobacterium jeungdonense]|uniref:Uncharacterized protein n=1 Tax=Cyclobacterium jeungdonense TaxID=708087 RepID=A0ABT8CB15_9BACT|nr:hypothetical protein [Cyclobacterium jeungdonense]MDN3689332.1 hypothetical protein [Cyclobacterium jeungdonense]